MKIFEVFNADKSIHYIGKEKEVLEFIKGVKISNLEEFMEKLNSIKKENK